VQMSCADVRYVDQILFRAVTVEYFAAGACHQGTSLLRWKPLATFPHRIFSRGPIPLIPPGLKFGLRPLGQKRAPRGLKIGARLVEGCSYPIRAFPRMTAGIETARPAPRIFVMRNSDALGDRAGLHVTIVDVPAFLAGFQIAAAGEFGHAPMFTQI
jgi:hypothetical protein